MALHNLIAIQNWLQKSYLSGDNKANQSLNLNKHEAVLIGQIKESRL